MKNHINTLVCVDIDGTLLKGQSQQYFLRFLLEKGLINFSYYARITFWFILHALHIANDPTKVMNEAYRVIQGKTEDEIDDLAQELFEKVLKPNIYPVIYSQIRNYADRGATVVVISNSTDILIKHVAAYIGADAYFATILKKENKIYTGDIIPPIMYGYEKQHALKRYIYANNLEEVKIVVYADRLSDIPLFEMAHDACLVNPNHKLERIAHTKGWSIINTK